MGSAENTKAPEALLSIAEARAILGISQASIYRIFERGELEVVAVGGRRMIEPEALRVFIASRRRRRSLKEATLLVQPRAERRRS